MTGRSPEARRSSTATRTPLGKLLKIVILLWTVVIAYAFAKYTLATRFQPYDDEGYMLLSLAHYVSEGSLYRHTYSQYGPFYFYAQQACFQLLRLPFTHDAGRFVTLLYWAASALFGGAFVYKISKSALLTSAAIASCILLGSTLANEPGHPQQVVLFLFVLACCLSLTESLVLSRVSLVALGAIGSALLFTKINVGVFYFAALAQTCLCLLPRSRIRMVGLGLMLAYAVGSPLLLMHSYFGEWARGYCLLAVLCGGSTFLCGSFLKPRVRLSASRLLWTLLGILTMAALVVIKTRSEDIPLRVLLEGVLWDPLKHPELFSLPLSVGPWEMTSALLFLGCAGMVWHLSERLRARLHLIGAVQCITGVVTIVALVCSPRHAVWVLPLLPLSLVSLKDNCLGLSYNLPRLFVANLAATQFLQSYPVAGSQLSVGAMPLLLWGFISIADGIDGLRTVLDLDGYPKYAVTSALILAFSFAGMMATGFPTGGYYFPASHLRGAQSLHLSPAQEGAYRFLAESIHANCDVLFTMPGMGSFNFWSGVPTPNGSNLTAWMKGFSVERQEEILGILQSKPRACVIDHRELVRFWGSTGQQLESSPLASYILHMRKVAARGGYEIRVQATRRSPWAAIEPHSCTLNALNARVLGEKHSVVLGGSGT